MIFSFILGKQNRSHHDLFIYVYVL